MAPKVRIVGVNLFLFFVLGYTISGICCLTSLPKIDHKYLEHIVPATYNYTVLCEGNEPLKWKTPFVKDEYLPWTKISVIETEPRHFMYRYASKLVIQNASFPFTGYYYCYYGNQKFEESEAAKIYLYMQDPEHLAVSEESLETLLVTQYSNAVIPCRPTSPDVNVDLTLVGGEKVEDATYDPKTGFEKYFGTLSDTGDYLCSFSRNDVSETIMYLIVFNQITNSLPKPLLTKVNESHSEIGKPINLKCQIKTLSHVTISWTTPSGRIDASRMNISFMERSKDNEMISQKLTIPQATMEDQGTYKCSVTDNQDHSTEASTDIKVYAAGEHFVKLSEENNAMVISQEAGKPVQWNIDVDGHPLPKLRWKNNENKTIEVGETYKYEVHLSPRVAFLKIKNVTLSDHGNYTLFADNGFDKESLELFLNVTGKPEISIEMDDFHLIDVPSKVTCVVRANPPPEIFLEHKDCQDHSCQFQAIEDLYMQQRHILYKATVHLKASHSGIVRCTARNRKGESSSTAGFFVSDVENGFDIYGIDESVNYNKETGNIVIAKGETFMASCGASISNYTNDIKWFYDAQPIDASKTRPTVEVTNTKYSNRITLKIDKVSEGDSGIYSCQVLDKDYEYKYKNISLTVSDSFAPKLIASNLNDTVAMDFPDKLELYCIIEGLPKPTIFWEKDGEFFNPSGNRILKTDDHQRLIFAKTNQNDEGVYSCHGRNKIGAVAKSVNVTFKNKPTYLIYIIVISILLIVVIVSAIIICLKTKKQRSLQLALRNAGLYNFAEGEVEKVNPELGIDDQAELLPYDTKWEFPISKLKLGKQLGAGAFGIVMRGEAKGIKDDEEVTTVAVKMVKRTADDATIKALASELKIMVHLGKHLNVVNLLGACTQKVVKKELLVIVEYCRYGNLHNYLFRHRMSFIDQRDVKTDQIDFNIGQEILSRSYSVTSNRSNNQSPLLKYAALSFSNSSSGPTTPNHMEDYRGDNYGGVTAKTETTVLSLTPTSQGENSNASQQDWRTNYRGDYKENVKPICTNDLLIWAFQVARGMDYLASRNVMHGDLAARNILLADNNVVKICDFGLAKNLYKKEYKKNSDGPLPIKWMAVESIRDRVFSTQSDVWSYGIVLWEFFSLARTPYPGMEADERLYYKLVEGYRMESPEFATNEIYKIMLDCWQSKPLSRPTFSRLVEWIGSLLEDGVRKHYIDLNDPYLAMNIQRREDGQSDYLAMFSPPNFENLSSPQHYVNENSPGAETPGYMCMKGSNIFSPRPDENSVFDFELHKKPKSSNTKDNNHELMPMLHTLNESDSDTSKCNTPMTPNSFSNPSYHMAPNIRDKKEMRNNIINLDDNNYINLPQKNILEMEPKNPAFLKIDEDTKDVHYVNSSTRDWESIQV